MGAAREGKNIWRYLFSKSPNGEWNGSYMLNRRFWVAYTYIMQDSVWTYLHRGFTCKVFGHSNVRDISDDSNIKEYFCFRCYRHVNQERINNVNSSRTDSVSDKKSC